MQNVYASNSKLWIVTINAEDWYYTWSTFLVGVFTDKKSADSAAAEANDNIISRFKRGLQVHVRQIEANMIYSVFKPNDDTNIDGVIRLDAE